MLKLIRKRELGHANYGWLDTYHHFSFANYYDATRMGFGKLRVINDDLIKAGSGFQKHGHRDMEIITFVREGTITHRDSAGNTGHTVAGDVQVMSAGTGIEHSEFSQEDHDASIFQIWIQPRQAGIAPRWESATFADKSADKTLPLLVSGRKEDEGKQVLYIHQDAAIYGGTMKTGQSLRHPIKYQAYLLVSKGHIEVDGQAASKGDGIGITQAETVSISALEDSEVILIDVPFS